MLGRPTINMGAVLAAALAHMPKNLIPTIYSPVHKTRQGRLGPGKKRAPFATPEYAERYERRLDRYARHRERTGGRGPWPAHLQGGR